MIVNVVAGYAVRAYEPGRARPWDDLVSRSYNATFLHERRFISIMATVSNVYGRRWVDTQ